MTNLLEEVNEYFDFLYRSKKINFYEFNSYEFCELKLIKDMDEKFHQKGDIERLSFGSYCVAKHHRVLQKFYKISQSDYLVN